MTKILIGLSMMCFSSVVYAEGWQTSADLRERYQSFDNFNFNSTVDQNRSEFDSRLYIKAKKDFDNGVTCILATAGGVDKKQDQNQWYTNLLPSRFATGLCAI
ncbi:MAG: hypothetical protein Q9N62_03605 [Ghiorsea sp.]|nr:hypothetical protein [Ghiorsea sp.]